MSVQKTSMRSNNYCIKQEKQQSLCKNKQKKQSKEAQITVQNLIKRSKNLCAKFNPEKQESMCKIYSREARIHVQNLIQRSKNLCAKFIQEKQEFLFKNKEMKQN